MEWVVGTLSAILVSSDPFIADRLKVALTAYPDILLHETSADFLPLLQPSDTYIVLIDPDLPDLDPVTLIKTARLHHPSLIILGFTENQNVGCIRAMLQSGASGYILSTDPLEALPEVLLAAAAGRNVFSPRVVQLLLQSPST